MIEIFLSKDICIFTVKYQEICDDRKRISEPSVFYDAFDVEINVIW